VSGKYQSPLKTRIETAQDYLIHQIYFKLEKFLRNCGLILIHPLILTYHALIPVYFATAMGEKMNAYRILVVKPEGKRPLGRPRSRWVDNIKWILERYGGMVWTGSIWLRIGSGGGLL
jgi:hypothetical protein